MKLATLRLALLLLPALAGSAPAGAQELGRLFTTPAERAALDRWRDGGPAPAGQTAPAPPGASVPERQGAGDGAVAEQRLVVNGIVTRSGSGRTTTWVNSVPYHGSGRLQGNVTLVQGRSAPAVALTLESGRRVLLKPGQSLDPASGRVREAYQKPPAQ